MNLTENFESLVDTFTKNTAKICGILFNIDDQIFFRKPTQDGWCVAEIIEHLLISDRTGLFAIVRKSQPTERNPLEIMGLLEERSSTKNLKIEAPEAAMPKGIFKTKEEAIDAWKSNRENVLKKVNPDNIWMLAAGFEHPKLGMLTTAEWMLFMCWHSEHHLPQIERCI
ncbi:MAG: DinB family protein [Sphingomonadales bacterium]|nr:DinB family protein [Sphingomonadales bacterium]